MYIGLYFRDKKLPKSWKNTVVYFFTLVAYESLKLCIY